MATTKTENGNSTQAEATGTDIVRAPHGLERLQRRPVIDTIDENTLRLIASQIAQGCNRGEIGHFLELCAHYDLDPFAKEAWCAKSKGDNARLLIMVGRDGLRKIAKRQGLEIDGDVVRGKDTYEVEFIDSLAALRRLLAEQNTPLTALDQLAAAEWDANGRTPFHHVTHKRVGMGEGRGAILGAWCRVKNRDRHEVGWFEAQIGEYKPRDQRKLQYSPWGSQESVMILAAAERQALRQATPLGGLLAEGEDARVIDAQVVEEDAPLLPQELSDEEVDKLVGIIAGHGWSEDEARMQLVASGASDVSDLRTGVASLTREAALELITRLDSDIEEVDAVPADAQDEGEEA